MKKLFLIFGVLISGLLLTGCGGSPAALSWPGITFDDASGTIFVAYNLNVYSLQSEDGDEQWRFRPERDNSFQTYAPPTLTEDGQLLIGGYNNTLYSLDPASGELNWDFNGASNRYIGSPLELSGIIFAPNSDHRLYTLDSSGDLQWTYGTEQPLWSQPASDGSLVFLASMDHHIHAVDAQSGELIWESDLGGTLVGSPVLGEDALYIGTLNKQVIALDPVNGSELWVFDTSGWVWGSPVLIEDQLLAADLEGTLYSLDPTTGSEIWSLDLEAAITGTPLVIGEQICVVTEDDEVIAVSLDGQVQWSETLSEERDTRFLGIPTGTEEVNLQLYGSCVAAGDLILVGATNSNTVLAALDSNGDTVWTFVPEN